MREVTNPDYWTALDLIGKAVTKPMADGLNLFVSSAVI